MRIQGDSVGELAVDDLRHGGVDLRQRGVLLANQRLGVVLGLVDGGRPPLDVGGIVRHGGEEPVDPLTDLLLEPLLAPLGELGLAGLLALLLPLLRQRTRGIERVGVDDQRRCRVDRTGRHEGSFQSNWGVLR